MEQPPIPPGYVQYPRSNLPGSPGPGSGVVRFGALSQAWTLFTGNCVPFLLAVLLLFGAYLIALSPFVITIVQEGLAQGLGGQTPSNSSELRMIPYQVGTNLLVSVAGGILLAGFLYAGLRTVRGERIGEGDLFQFNGRFGTVILAELCVAPLMAVPIIATAIPRWADVDYYTATFVGSGLSLGSYLIVGIAQLFLTFVPLLIIDKGLTLGKAIAMSAKTAGRHFWPLLGLLFVATLIGNLSIACLCLPGFLGMPVYLLARSIVYHDLFDGESAAAVIEPL